MARKVAQRVMETGEPELIRMELNSFARRVVHMSIAEVGGLKTESVGEGPHKQVRVVPSPGTLAVPSDGEPDVGEDNLPLVELDTDEITSDHVEGADA